MVRYLGSLSVTLLLSNQQQLDKSDLCIRHKKVFSHEHALYPPPLLPVHLPFSGRPSKVALKEPIEGGIHPRCGFCRDCFFGDDELYSHMRERHEECFICKRNGIRDQ